MLVSSLFTLSAFVASSFAACNAATRLKFARQVVTAYNANTNAETATLASGIPFGVPDKPGVCTTVIRPNGGPPVPVAFTGNGVVNFLIETRQVFSRVTGEYEDFGANGTAVIYTNVTLGVRSTVPVPITFAGQVYLDYNNACRIYAVRAYAQVPTEVLGVVLNYQVPIPDIPLPIKT